jgi:hypothetical protein
MKTEDKWAVASEGEVLAAFLVAMHENIFALANIAISQSLLLMNEHIQREMLCYADVYLIGVVARLGDIPCRLLSLLGSRV